MTTQPPPPRYRVVEQGRRLVVIDTLTGQSATRSAVVTPSRGTLPAAPERTDFDGRSTLVTHGLYDDKAPRTLTLDPGAANLVQGVRSILIGGLLVYGILVVLMPWLLLPVIVLLNPRVRATLRAPVTRWLDRYDADTSTG